MIKDLGTRQIAAEKIILIAAYIALLTFSLAGCGSRADDSTIAKPEDFVGTWETTHLELGGKPLDLTQASFTLDLDEDMTGTLTTGLSTQDVEWEIRGFYGEYVDVQIVVSLQESVPVGDVDADLKGLNLLYSTEDQTLSFEQSWHGDVNGMDARFELSGVFERNE